jgi:hypothetical protein
MEARMKEIEKEIALIRKEIRLAKWIPSCVSVVCAIACKLFTPAPLPPPPQPAEVKKSTTSEAVGNTVNIGLDDSKADPQRDWLTVAEVAEKEQLSERTITTYIASGRIEADKSKRAFRIPKTYQVQPPRTADNSGN